MLAPGLVFLSIVPIAFGVLLAFMSIRAIYITVTPPRGGVQSPSCEKCRYPVSGLNTLSCPECGTDLRLSGIITRAMEARRRGGLAGAIMGWSFLMLCTFGLFAAAAASRATAVAAPGLQVMPAVYTTELKPASGAYRSVVIEWPSIQTISPATREMYAAAAELTLNDGTRHRLEVSPTMDCILAGENKPSRKLSHEAVAAWYRSVGLDTAPPALAEEVGEVVRLLDEVLTSSRPDLVSLSAAHFQVGAVSSTNSTFAPPATRSVDRAWLVVGSVTSVAIVVWVLGVVGIVLRRRGLLREAALRPS